jgi:hypothetical protein
VPMLAELVDAVVGVDTHRDTHQVEIALPTCAPIAHSAVIELPSAAGVSVERTRTAAAPRGRAAAATSGPPVKRNTLASSTVTRTSERGSRRCRGRARR